ncbi:hypothetical protein H0H87_007619 [Tephrocybe sp. NHM501043]|nr:hypothetical protein H0H87_007619 [Tephrocybe sp. NHM501043]
MSVTPGKPRQTAIPGSSRPSGIPTPGRSRASSAVVQQQNPNANDVEYMSRAFAEAIKANDPAQHRPSPASLSPQSASFAQSGRRSVAARPSSRASTSSVASSTYPRAKTPVQSHSRPSSRVSEAHSKMTPRSFEVGDNVRIESLGYEGVLRYLGPIEGKQGSWAGVQLSGGFTGKGKNNGTVNGVQYFTCPESCGVFVAVSKLSAPTVGVGAIARPPSVASSRGGRITPAHSASSSIGGPRKSLSSSISSGRVTPSTSGRITPSTSSGHVTPGVTPSARARRPFTKSTPSKPEVPVPVQKFTAGSRASKYVSMTAKQLSSRDAATGSPRRLPDLESPTRSMSSPSSYTRSITSASPTRSSIGSSFATPKPGLNGRSSIGGGITPGKIRPSGSLTTPRPRIPSAIAMPPPASPMFRSISLGDRSMDSLDSSDVEAFAKSVHDKSFQFKSPSTASTRSDSVTSMRSMAADEHALIEQLQSRIDALEYDNERLRTTKPLHDTYAEQRSQQDLEHARAKINSLEAALTTSKGEVEGQQARVKLLEDDKHRMEAALDAQNIASESNLAALQVRMDAELVVVEELRVKVEQQEKAAQQNDITIHSKDQMIFSLESKLTALTAELQAEKTELGLQIDELRSAGQETIALYEERLSAADSQRYDLEHRISTLETRLQTAQNTASASPPTLSGTSAMEIDNETLREQVVHLQHKIATMEDTIEDAQASAEREETLIRERMKRVKEKEDAMRKELNEGRKEVELILKSEAKAKSRVEEIEEALRESTVALENARAEVENLRAELANLDGLVANSSGGDLSSRVAEAAQRAANEKAHYMQEIAELQDSIERYRTQETYSAATDVQITELKHENISDTTKELETLRKKHNRDTSINNGLQESLRPLPSSPSSKYDVSAAKEEITGLKHIVQELQKENVTAMQRIKILESENQLLSSETDQLRQEVQILEENLDKSLDLEESIADGSRKVSEDSPRKLKEQRNRLEVEQEQLRKRFVEAEMKSTRTIHDLNKEISELEALVESKIYREDELEQELERLRDKLARQIVRRLEEMSFSAATARAMGILQRTVHILSMSSNYNTLYDDDYGDVTPVRTPYKTFLAFNIVLITPLMSYASVAASNAPPQVDQANPALLNTTPLSVLADFNESNSRVNVIPNPATQTPPVLDEGNSDNPRPSKKANRRLQEVEAEGLYLWEVTKHFIFRPGVAGGLIGLVNLGLLAGAGRTFYTQPHLRKDCTVVSSSAAAAFALLSLEGYAAERYRKTECGKAEERRSREEGTLIYKHLREQILRPGVLGGIVGLCKSCVKLWLQKTNEPIVNTAVLSAVGYFSFIHWDRPTWDRRVISAVAVGLLALWGGEGYAAQSFCRDN